MAQSVLIVTATGKIGALLNRPVGAGRKGPRRRTTDKIATKRKIVLLLKKQSIRLKYSFEIALLVRIPAAARTLRFLATSKS